ncbi:tat twin-arginine translocation pathway signal sequence domain protein [Asticcacaulis biprosthecium C19]|uniref:Fluoride-specific ion channel FluC n=1 Tax=Asticcacaulis biprosthecium C19 TaxID=715226 RepID=F4QSQ8_9CAUL|nr:fluoride efflux transporter CrcB [Asticcacaulis biprosthecium]EGF89778.1 tat twin-arginine translocation pathway signal sequence domain protein [Asticcacaulis biprosthecium C19]
MINVLLVMLGGALGSLARYGLGRSLNSAWPMGTFVANVAGGLLMGVLMALLIGPLKGEAERLRLLLGVGVLGGFTTFSSFSLETVQMLERRDYVQAAAYAGFSVVLSVAAVAIGMMIVRKVTA